MDNNTILFMRYINGINFNDNLYDLVLLTVFFKTRPEQHFGYH